MSDTSRTDLAPRLLALVEVTLAFAAMHVAFRAIKRFTEWGRWELERGLNFSPGAVMIVVALALIALRGRGVYGLSPRPFAPAVSASLAALVVLGLFGGALTAAGVDLVASRDHWGTALTVALLSLPAAALLLWVLARGWFERVPLTVGVLVVAGVPALPIVAGLHAGRGVEHELLTLAWLALGAGLGEELFFRGYVQSRLNESYGRPWRVLGVDFGPGLLIASALFALVHLLNPADYFGGELRLAWPHAVATFATLHYGLLRERTGSIWAPVIVHFYADLAGRWPALMDGSLG